MLDIVNNLVCGKKILLVAYDAGGANQLFSLFKKLSGYQSLKVVSDGPAKKMYQQIYQKEYICEGILSDLVAQADMVVTGTGLGSNLEYEAVAIAKNKSTYAISLLDHWVNYRERFIRNKIQVLPDEIWVVDHYAQILIKNIFPKAIIKLVPDVYAEDIVEDVTLLNCPVKNQALFLLEPIVYDGVRTSYLNPLEIFYFENFFKEWKLLNKSKRMTLKLRTHPSEPAEKYLKYTSSPSIVLSDSSLLSNDLAESSLIVGYHSYALTIAKRLSKKVLCALPFDVKCKLPHADIPRIFS